MDNDFKPSHTHVVAVFGAAGHTGRFVVAELLRRGIVPIALARDPAGLAKANFPNRVLRRQASVDDAQSLDKGLDGAQAIINCAGPFLDTADAVADAALRAGIHYLDVTAEQLSARTTLDKFDTAARQAGIAIIPAMGFYGGFGDLLVTAALGDWDHADAVDIMIALDSWHPTHGTRITGARNTVPRVVVSEGRLNAVPLPLTAKHWEFGEPLGGQSVVEVPLSEIILISRHVKTIELHTYLTSNALSDVENPNTPAPTPADTTGRSAQRFVVDVRARCDGRIRRIIARGRDIYAFSAPLVCEAVANLLDGNFRGVGAQPPGAIFDARKFLSALTASQLGFEITSDDSSQPQ